MLPSFTCIDDSLLDLLDWRLASVYFSTDVLLLNFCSCFWLAPLMTDMSLRGCAQIKGEQHRNVLNWLLLHVIALLEMYCTASLHKYFFPLSCYSHIHSQSWGTASVKNSGRERHREGSTLLYFLFPLKTDFKNNMKFPAVLPIYIINAID